MSDRARRVLRLIDQAEQVRERHPTLFAAQLRSDRTCLQLAYAVERYKRAKQPVGGRTERDDVERIDPQTEAQLTQRAAERYERRKRDFDAERRGHRAGMSTLELHRAAVERQAKISTVAAGNVEPGRGGDGPVGPPRQQQLDDDPRWREHEAVIRSRLERMHELLDEAEGLGAVAEKAMISAEKDQLILTKGKGMSASAVVALLGTDVAGSPETVRRVRRRAGVSVKDGLEREQVDLPAATVRRVVIDREGAS